MSSPRPVADRAADVFAALGDGTRRELLAALAAIGEATATQLAASRPLSRQAVVKHLQILAAAGLVEAHKVGREQRYRPRPAALRDAAGWMDEVGAAWDRRLAALERRHP